MSNARNLANLLTGGDTTIATGDVANDAITMIMTRLMMMVQVSRWVI